MQLPSRPLALLAFFVLPAAGWAGPVPATDAVASHEVQTVVTPAGLSVQALSDGVTPAAASSPSGSALAAELIKESGAGVHATEAPAQPRRASLRAAGAPTAATATTTTAPGATIPGQPATADEDWGLRELSKATVHWLKQTVPWLRDDVDEHDPRPLAPADDWSASPLDRDARRSPHRPPDVSATTAADAAIRATPDYPAQPHFFDPEQNLVRVAVDAVREVLEHPMAWLVALLLVVGAIVVKKIDRRPTK